MPKLNTQMKIAAAGGLATLVRVGLYLGLPGLRRALETAGPPVRAALPWPALVLVSLIGLTGVAALFPAVCPRLSGTGPVQGLKLGAVLALVWVSLTLSPGGVPDVSVRVMRPLIDSAGILSAAAVAGHFLGPPLHEFMRFPSLYRIMPGVIVAAAFVVTRLIQYGALHIPAPHHTGLGPALILWLILCGLMLGWLANFLHNWLPVMDRVPGALLKGAVLGGLLLFYHASAWILFDLPPVRVGLGAALDILAVTATCLTFRPDTQRRDGTFTLAVPPSE